MGRRGGASENATVSQAPTAAQHGEWEFDREISGDAPTFRIDPCMFSNGDPQDYAYVAVNDYGVGTVSNTDFDLIVPPGETVDLSFGGLVLVKFVGARWYSAAGAGVTPLAHDVRGWPIHQVN